MTASPPRRYRAANQYAKKMPARKAKYAGVVNSMKASRGVILVYCSPVIRNPPERKIMSHSVLTEAQDDVLVVTLNRPELRNAVDGPTAKALVEAFQAFDTDERFRVAVFTGAGATFCAGADLKAV